MRRKSVIIGSVCFFLILAGLSYSCKYNKQDPYISLDEPQSKQEDTEVDDGADDIEEAEEFPQVIYVHICGAVNNPGVYSMDHGGRLIDLVQLAGGFSHEAARDYMNQAQEVEDGSRIYIPTNKELSQLSIEEHIQGEEVESLENSSEDGLININKADLSQLMRLSGIGEAKAKSIIDYRNSHGEFKQIEDIMKISGIKEGLFDKISDKITIK